MSATIIDFSNWARRRFEAGASFRTCYAEVCAVPGTIVVSDGAYALERRRALFPNYKVRRNRPPDLMYKQLDLLRTLLGFAPCVLVRVPRWEADDVIATLVRTANGAHTIIRSTDVDFGQLPNVTLDRDKPLPEEPQFLRTYKALVGDPSDCIPGLKGFGKGGWSKLDYAQKMQLQNWMERGGDTPEFLPVGPKNWLAKDTAHRRLLKTYYEIVGLWDVPMAEIGANTEFGVHNPAAFETMIGDYL